MKRISERVDLIGEDYPVEKIKASKAKPCARNSAAKITDEGLAANWERLSSALSRSGVLKKKPTEAPPAPETVPSEQG